MTAAENTSRRYGIHSNSFKDLSAGWLSAESISASGRVKRGTERNQAKRNGTGLGRVRARGRGIGIKLKHWTYD